MWGHIDDWLYDVFDECRLCDVFRHDELGGGGRYKRDGHDPITSGVFVGGECGDIGWHKNELCPTGPPTPPPVEPNDLDKSFEPGGVGLMGGGGPWL